MSKKRKCSEIYKPPFLPCDICSNRVYNYELCTAPFVYCSIDCLSIIVLSHQNKFLHEQNENIDKSYDSAEESIKSDNMDT